MLVVQELISFSEVYRSVNYILSRLKSMNYKGAHENFASDPVQFTLRYPSEKIS